MAALVCLAASLIGFLFKGNTRKRILLLLVPAAFGLCYYKLTAERLLYPTEALEDETLTVRAEVEDYPQYTDNSVILHLSLREKDLPES